MVAISVQLENKKRPHPLLRAESRSQSEFAESKSTRPDKYTNHVKRRDWTAVSVTWSMEQYPIRYLIPPAADEPVYLDRIPRPAKMVQSLPVSHVSTS